MPADAVKRLRNHLRDERDALLGGRVSELEAISARRDELISVLEDLKIGDTSVLEELRHQARRNQDLVDATLAGLGAARKRLDEVRRAATQLDTYTSGGERKNLLGGKGRVERRA